IQTPALLQTVLYSCLPASAHAAVVAVIDQPHSTPHHSGYQDVAHAVVDGIVMRHPFFLHDHAFHADLRGRRRHHARMVRLHATDLHQCVGSRGDGIGHDVFHLAKLVAATVQVRVDDFAI